MTLFITYQEIQQLVVDKLHKDVDADRLRIHLAAIPQLQNVLQNVKVDSIYPQKDGLQVNAKMK